MVFSSSGGVRTFVALAAMYALSSGATLPVRAEVSEVASASGSVAVELLEECGVSDGDKSFGIQAITDLACASGGLGCYNDHCRYCKVLDTLKSAHLESCESLGASFPTMAPLAASEGPCNVSSGDSAVGIAGMTDPSCLYGGIGCFSDHCRFCRIETTPQSSQFVSCSWTSGSTSGSSDTGDIDFVLVNSDEYKPESAQTILSSSNSGNEEAFEAGVASVCTTTAADGDLAVGISVTTDATCASGGVGCIDSICRFCKTRDTPQSAHLNPCPVATKVCTTTVSSGDAAVGINIVTDTSCASGGLGCIDSVCRFCRLTTTAQSAPYTDCALIGSSASATQAPAATTSAPTTAPVTTAPTPAPTATKQACSQTVSDGDAAVGINIVTDSSCASGGLGCIDQVCRFCRVTTSTQSASFIDCASITGTAATTSPASAAPTTAPATTTAAPTTVVPTTAAPTTAAPATAAPATASPATAAPATASPATAAPATTTPATTAPATSATPSIVFECSRTVSSGDKGVGLDIVSDVRCSDGGTGCLDDVCRFCKRFDTAQSQTYINCSSIPPSNIGADIAFVPIPVVSDSDAPTRLLLSSSADSLEATSASFCTTTVSAGDAAVGISIVTDSSCSSGGTGCIDQICRYCKTTDTIQSAHLNSCPTSTATAPTAAPTPAPTTSAGTTTTKTCASTVSDGDAAVGIGIITDLTCASGGLGCMSSVCRLCKTKSTDQSAHLGSCSDYSSTATSTPATTAPATTTITPATASPTAAPTTAPVTTVSAYSIPLDCYQTASNGDKSLGLDIVTDIRCGDGGVGCVDSICRFCKRFETTQSHSYMSCSDIPSADNGADITFKVIPAVEATQETASSEMLVAVHEATEFSSDQEEACSNVNLADGQAAGGIGVVLDTLHCPEGLAPGCIGDSGCRYCMRFPTNISDYLDYCEIANASDVAYALSGEGITSAGEGSSFSVEERRKLLVDSGDDIAAEDNAQTSDRATLVKSETAGYAVVGVVVCAGVVVVVGLAAFGMKRTVKTLKRKKPKVDPDQGDENRPRVLVTSNVGEPGIISDV